MNSLNKNKEFFTVPKNFYQIDSFVGVNADCLHNEFTLTSGNKNVKGQYSLTKTCKGCKAYRKFYLYAKVVKKGGRK